MKKTLLITPLVIILLGCSNKLTVRKEAYDLKTYSDVRDQTVDLKQYESPNTRDGQDASTLVIVCASGGGSRAAAFTIGALLELEEIKTATQGKNVADEIDYFSTTSGGGWGSSSFIAYKYQNLYEGQHRNEYTTFNSFEKILSNRSNFRYFRHQSRYLILGPLATSKSDWVFTNRLNVGYLGWGYRDSNKTGASWPMTLNPKSGKKEVDEIMLSDVFIPKGKGKARLPMLIANTTNIDNYKLVPFSPDRLQYWGVNEYIDLFGNSVAIPPSTLFDIPLASGIKASSSVPGFISSSYFKSRKNNTDYYLHLQDGGITDNQGLHTVKAILDHEKQISDKQKRIVIVIDASGSGIHNAGERYKKKYARRVYSAGRWAASTPDAQYPLMRERLISLQKENNCTVIYLGTEVLLDTSLGKSDSIPPKLIVAKKEAEAKFLKMYQTAKTDRNYFNTVDMDERSLLYEYISSEVSTWFNTVGSVNRGKYVLDATEETGTGQVMFLAGRGVVQLMSDKIARAFSAAASASGAENGIQIQENTVQP